MRWFIAEYLGPITHKLLIVGLLWPSLATFTHCRIPPKQRLPCAAQRKPCAAQRLPWPAQRVPCAAQRGPCPAQRGRVPDLLVGYSGYFFLVEVKSEKGTLTPDQ